MASSEYTQIIILFYFFVLQLDTTLSLEDESTGLLPGSMSATQSLVWEGQPLAAVHCGMLPHTYRNIVHNESVEPYSAYFTYFITLCIFVVLQHQAYLLRVGQAQ